MQWWTPSNSHPDSEWLDRVRDALVWWERQQPEHGATSSVTGRGAVTAAEQRISELHDGRRALLTPSGTHALLTAFRVLGIGPGDEVLLPSADWPASQALVRLLRATPILVDVDPVTGTITPAACTAARTSRTKAVLATHHTDAPVDVIALRSALPGVPVVEDCAAALGVLHNGTPVGTLGDLAVLSFGPGKRIDAGEGGALLAAADDHWQRAIQLTAHPLRQSLLGIGPDLVQPSMRPHPLMAILVAHALRRGLPNTNPTRHLARPPRRDDR